MRVETYERGTEAPIRASVLLDGRPVGHGPVLDLLAPFGPEITVRVEMPGYAAMEASAVLSGPTERWAFYLDRQYSPVLE